jgi:hypothetical protein
MLMSGIVAQGAMWNVQDFTRCETTDNQTSSACPTMRHPPPAPPAPPRCVRPLGAHSLRVPMQSMAMSKGASLYTSATSWLE